MGFVGAFILPFNSFTVIFRGGGADMQCVAFILNLGKGVDWRRKVGDSSLWGCHILIDGVRVFHFYICYDAQLDTIDVRR